MSEASTNSYDELPYPGSPFPADPSGSTGPDRSAVWHAAPRGRLVPRARTGMHRRRKPDPDGDRTAGQRVRRHRPVPQADRAGPGNSRRAEAAQHPVAAPGHHGPGRRTRPVRLHHRARRLLMGAAGSPGPHSGGRPAGCSPRRGLRTSVTTRIPAGTCGECSAT